MACLAYIMHPGPTLDAKCKPYHWIDLDAYLVQELIEEDIKEPARRVELWGNVANVTCEEAGLPKACSQVTHLSS